MTSIHPEENRFLSPRECARIQSFPNRFIFKGTTIENYTQICNAVPPLLAKAFGCYIIKVLTGVEINPIPWDIWSSNNYQIFIGKVKSKSYDNNFPLQLELPF